MRYFTKEIWAGWQEDPPTRNWNALWRKHTAAYHRQLRRLRHRLPKRAFAFFTDRSLHDARFGSLIVSEAAGEGRSRRSLPVTRVEIEVTTMTTPPIRYRLRYDQVSTIVLDVPSKQPLFTQQWASIS